MVGDFAKWSRSDDDCPKGSIGEVMGYDDLDDSIVLLQFEKGGKHFAFNMKELSKVKGKKVKKR